MLKLVAKMPVFYCAENEFVCILLACYEARQGAGYNKRRSRIY
jgi:hypothetical protein